MSSKDLPAFLKNPNYQQLVHHYRDHPIALYAGAGASRSSDTGYGVGLWDQLLEDILASHVGADSPTLAEFKTKLKTVWAATPWASAEWASQMMGETAFKETVVALVQRPENFPRRRADAVKEYRQLSRPYLDTADTLRAICAFCAQLTGQVQATHHPSYRVQPNRRVHAIVTSNYDPFLEAGSSTMFIRSLLKSVAAFGSQVGGLDQIPVFHIHGYVPYPPGKKMPVAQRIPFVHPVVRTSDYVQAWEPRNAYSTTMGPQIHLLRHYTTLFIGFSFRDMWVNNLLRALCRELPKPHDPLPHYALLLHHEIADKGKPFFDELGVNPIGLESYNQVPVVLGHLYAKALAHDYGTLSIPLPRFDKGQAGPLRKPAHLSLRRYWETLLSCRNCAVVQYERCPLPSL